MSGDTGVRPSAPSGRNTSSAPTATTTTAAGSGSACLTCGHGERAVPDGGLDATTTTTPTSGTSPVDRLLMGTTWDRESFRIALDAAGLAATLLLIYMKVNE